MKILSLFPLFVALLLHVAQAASPTISSFQPIFGAPGDTIRIFGQNFLVGGQADVQVYFGGGLQSATVTGVFGGEIDVTVPTGATIGPIIVQKSTGSAQSKSDFTAGPSITSFIRQTPIPTTDDDNHRGNVGDTVFVEGLNFESGTGTRLVNVYFGSVLAATQTRGNGALVATVPPNAVTGPLIISNRFGSTSSTGSDYFYLSPVISSFTAKAAVGGQVSLAGKSFLAVTNIQLGGISIPDFTIQGSTGTNITFPVPPNAPISGKITVISGGNIAITTQNFLLLPSVTGISAPGGAPGASVSLSGFGLTGATNISFGGIPSKPTTSTATSLTVKVPVGALTGPLMVGTPNGSGTSSTNFYVSPRITQFSPLQGIPGATVTLTGVNFWGASGVSFNGIAATDFTVLSATSIQVTVPPKTKTGLITVTNPGGTGQSATSFASLGTLPIVNSFSPLLGAVGTSVTINGLNFTTATAVKFNGTLATTYVVVSDSKITATVPAGATTGPISVTGPDGSSTSTSNFVVGTTADLNLQASASSATPVTGENFTVNFTINNVGPIPASAAKISFQSPAVTTLTQATASAGTVTFDAKSANFNLGNMAVGTSASGQLTLRANTNASFTLTLVASSTTPDPNPTNNTVTFSVQSNPVALQAFSVSPQTIHLSWPTGTPDYLLEKSPKLVPQSWTTVTDTPESDGSQYFLNLTVTGNSLYFRLRKP